MSRRGRPRHEPHVRLYRHEIESPAFHSLSGDSVKLLVVARSLYAGRENRIFLSLRDIQCRLGIGRRRAEKARDELIDRGFIRILKRGGFSRRLAHATEYALTNEPLDPDRDGATAPKDYMRWRPDGKSPVHKTHTACAQNAHSAPPAKPSAHPNCAQNVHRARSEWAPNSARNVHTDNLPGGLGSRAPRGAMACPCGGVTAPDGSRHLGFELIFQRCGSCGRCGGYRLRRGRQVLAFGQVARRAFGNAAALAQLQGGL